MQKSVVLKFSVNQIKAVIFFTKRQAGRLGVKFCFKYTQVAAANLRFILKRYLKSYFIK